MASGSSDIPDPLSKAVAGLSVVFLFVAIVLFWLLVIMFENKWFDVIFCRKGSKNGDAADNDTDRRSLFAAHQNQ